MADTKTKAACDGTGKILTAMEVVHAPPAPPMNLKTFKDCRGCSACRPPNYRCTICDVKFDEREDAEQGGHDCKPSKITLHIRAWRRDHDAHHRDESFYGCSQATCVENQRVLVELQAERAVQREEGDEWTTESRKV